MSRRLYDLAGADPDCRFSPYCNRIRRALHAKRLDFETVPVAFTDKEALAFSGQKLVPVLVDGERVIADSWAIVSYLEETYPKPSLMGGKAGRALTLTFRHWVETAIHPLILKAVLMDIHNALAPVDQAYFRETREARFGSTLEALHQGAAALPQLARALEPARATLRELPWICGDRPGFADFILAGAFDWARAVSGLPLLESDDPVNDWYDRLNDRQTEEAGAA